MTQVLLTTFNDYFWKDPIENCQYAKGKLENFKILEPNWELKGWFGIVSLKVITHLDKDQRTKDKMYYLEIPLSIQVWIAAVAPNIS